MKKIAGLFVSLIMMAVIFSKIDMHAFTSHWREIHPGWLSIAFLFFIPQTWLSAWRWQRMIRDDRKSGIGECMRLILATSSLNVFLPSKLGDLAKAYYLARTGKMAWQRGLNQVLFERFLDLWALCLVGAIGVTVSALWTPVGWTVLAVTIALTVIFLLILMLPLRYIRFSFLPGKMKEKAESFFKDAHEYVERLKARPGELTLLLCCSLFLWLLHVVQFYFIVLAVNSSLSLMKVLSFIPVGILIGLLPFTVAGIGTRDAAFIYLFSPYESAAKIIFLGLFATVRYLVPGLAGLPFIPQFFSDKMRGEIRN